MKTLTTLRGLASAAALALLTLTTAACSGEPVPASTEGASSSAAPEGDVALLGSEENAAILQSLYDQAIAAGQTTITVYGITATSSASLYEAFQERYPGITVEHVSIAGSDLQARIAGEQTTGQYIVDNVSVSGGDAVFLAENDYLFDQEVPLAAELPDEYKPVGDRLIGGNKYLYTVSYNTDAIEESEVPHSFDELLDPALAGRIGISDPQSGATGFIAAAIRAGVIDEAWLRDFAATDPVVFPSERDLFTAVSTGQIDIGVGNYIRGQAFLEQDELPVGFIAQFEDGVSDGVFYRGTVENAPNPIASELLVNWWLTPEAQALIAEQGQPGLVPGAPAVPGQPPLSEIKVNPAPSFDEFAEYSTWSRELFKTAFSG